MPGRISLVIVSVLLITGTALFADQEAEDSKLEELGRQYLEESFKFDPVYATQLGVYDANYLRYPDYSKKSLKRFESKLKSLDRDLGKVKQELLDEESRIDYLLLESDINTQLLYLERSPLLRNNPKTFSSAAVYGVYLLLNSASHPDSVKLEFILKRLEDLPRFLNSAREILKNPPRLWSVLAEEEAEDGLQLLSDVAAYYTERVPSRSDEITSIFGKATAALESFIELVDALELMQDSDFSFGRENYDKLLRIQHFLEFDSDSLLRLGEALFEQASIDYDSVKAIVDTLTGREEQRFFLPRSFSKGDILDYYQWEIDQSRDWVDISGYATVPTDIGACVPLEMPEFLRNIVGGIAYEPAGVFAPVQKGIFYVSPLPDTLDETSRSAFFKYCMLRGFQSSTVHEAYPGHHLQLQIANHHSSLIRRIQRNDLMVEGWALYCEEAVYRHGFYGDDLRAYLRVLGGVLFRAARIIVDVKLHTGEFTYQDAVGWMVENVNASVEYIESEVSRYSLTPTNPMSYLVGKLLIEDLRALYQSQHEDGYDLRDFHDLLLSQGSIPPTLLQRKLMGEFR